MGGRLTGHLGNARNGITRLAGVPFSAFGAFAGIVPHSADQPSTYFPISYRPASRDGGAESHGPYGHRDTWIPQVPSSGAFAPPSLFSAFFHAPSVYHPHPHPSLAVELAVVDHPHNVLGRHAEHLTCLGCCHETGDGVHTGIFPSPAQESTRSPCAYRQALSSGSPVRIGDYSGFCFPPSADREDTCVKWEGKPRNPEPFGHASSKTPI